MHEIKQWLESPCGSLQKYENRLADLLEYIVWAHPLCSQRLQYVLSVSISWKYSPNGTKMGGES